MTPIILATGAELRRAREAREWSAVAYLDLDVLEDVLAFCDVHRAWLLHYVGKFIPESAWRLVRRTDA